MVGSIPHGAWHVYNRVYYGLDASGAGGGAIMACHVRAIQGDITTLSVDAIVNAANTSLLGGGGVDGAIHRAAGPRLRDACSALGGCAVGDAKATLGYSLPARYIIHTVGPVWRGGGHGEADLLASCYRRAIEVADELHARAIVFPNISTGVYGYPVAAAAQIAITSIRDAVVAAHQMREVVLCSFLESDFHIYRKLLGADDG